MAETLSGYRAASAQLAVISAEYSKYGQKINSNGIQHGFILKGGGVYP